MFVVCVILLACSVAYYARSGASKKALLSVGTLSEFLPTGFPAASKPTSSSSAFDDAFAEVEMSMAPKSAPVRTSAATGTAAAPSSASAEPTKPKCM